ncbi:MAG: DNA polymerase Y family protein [Proteobacteria bacterium]|nr:DNA polymerase Y family protein [Pseudomonadota bacterium]
MLWLCLNFPNLPIDIFSIGEETKEPVVIVESTNTIIASNNTSQQLGIQNGMALSAAFVLSNFIQIKHRKKNQEIKKLEEVATSLFKYSSQISIRLPNSVLVEIGASIKLFYSTQHLRNQILQTITDLGLHAHTAVSPTPLAAIWLSRYKIDATAFTISDLSQYIDPLPTSIIEPENTSGIKLHDVGIKTIGQLARIPRFAVTQRWGTHALDQLDRAFGKKPDPQPPFSLPEYFNSEISLNLPASSVEELLFGIHRIIQSMATYLQFKQRRVTQFELSIVNEQKLRHDFKFKLLVPTRNPKHLTHLAQERLNRENISSRIESIHIRSIQELPLIPSSHSLLPHEEQSELSRSHLIDQLQARVGEKSVYGITVCSDHRPEKTWRETIPGEHQHRTKLNHRPSWLLRTPKALTSTSDIPHLRGPLTIIDGPERIETGWWDDQDIKRDYFIALTQDHSQVWIYKDTVSRNWFLHGIFA